MHELEGKFKFKVSFELPVTGILVTDATESMGFFSFFFFFK